jgi:hypothetical protein
MLGISFEDTENPVENNSAYLFDNSRLRKEFGLRFPPYAEWIEKMIREIRDRR